MLLSWTDFQQWLSGFNSLVSWWRQFATVASYRLLIICRWFDLSWTFIKHKIVSLCTSVTSVHIMNVVSLDTGTSCQQLSRRDLCLKTCSLVRWQTSRGRWLVPALLLAVFMEISHTAVHTSVLLVCHSVV